VVIIKRAINEKKPLHKLLSFIGASSLLFFSARLAELAKKGEIAHILWICHASNLLIAAGIFLCQVEFLRISVLWLIIGIPLWPIDILRTGIVEMTSIGTHYLGLFVGLVVLRQQKMGKYSWLFGLIWFLFLQQTARLFTPAELNVNLAHAAYPGWDKIFPDYWQYWLFITGCAALALWVISKSFSWLSEKIPLIMDNDK